jgi:hypothetical protein
MQHLYISISNFVRGPPSVKLWAVAAAQGLSRHATVTRAWLLHVDDLVPKESCVLYAVTLYSLKNGC